MDEELFITKLFLEVILDILEFVDHILNLVNLIIIGIFSFDYLKAP